MFRIVYAKSVEKDLRRISPPSLQKIKKELENLERFPDLPQIKQLKNHPIADYRLRVGNYRILFDVNWDEKEIYVLKIGHRKDVY